MSGNFFSPHDYEEDFREKAHGMTYAELLELREKNAFKRMPSYNLMYSIPWIILLLFGLFFSSIPLIRMYIDKQYTFKIEFINVEFILLSTSLLIFIGFIFSVRIYKKIQDRIIDEIMMAGKHNEEYSPENVKRKRLEKHTEEIKYIWFTMIPASLLILPGIGYKLFHNPGLSKGMALGLIILLSVILFLIPIGASLYILHSHKKLKDKMPDDEIN